MIRLFGCQNRKKATLRLEEWSLQVPLNSGFVWEPAGGFEPSTCCLRISWLVLHHCPLVSMDVEFSWVSLFPDSTEMCDCVRLFIYLAVSLAVKKGANAARAISCWPPKNNVLQLALQPIAFSD